MDKKEPKVYMKVFNYTLNKLKKADYFGAPISLNFKGETTFKTSIGGALSIIILLGLLAYTGFLMSVMINRDNTSLNVVTQIDRLIDNPVSMN